MDNLTKYLNKISYKFPKGYPDMDDPQDKNMLFEMVTSLLENDADEAINILKKELNLTDDNFSKLSDLSLSFNSSKLGYNLRNKGSALT